MSRPSQDFNLNNCTIYSKPPDDVEEEIEESIKEEIQALDQSRGKKKKEFNPNPFKSDKKIEDEGNKTNGVMSNATPNTILSNK